MNRRRIFILQALCAAVISLALTAGTPARAASSHIEEGRYVRIGGIEQWISIKGADRANPVLLVLHGGPGNAWSPYAASMFAGWDRDFTVVQWDQRGAGRTFGKSGPSIADTMTIERMVQDGIEVALFLKTHLGKDRIMLTGGSWGSMLGLQMVQARPDLFDTMVGFAPVVNLQASIAAGYARVLHMARSAGDQTAIDALTSLGAPPWQTIRKWPLFRTWLRTYQSRIVTAPLAPRAISSEYASAQEEAMNEAADDFSFIHFWEMTLSGPLMQVDLASRSLDYGVPVHLVAGAEDLTAPPELAKLYFDGIRAPRKQFHLVPGTGHEPSVPQLALVHKILLDEAKLPSTKRQ
jgi:pimeloyl-ACP methyl ester carboxylesterase